MNWWKVQREIQRKDVIHLSAAGGGGAVEVEITICYPPAIGKNVHDPDRSCLDG